MAREPDFEALLAEGISAGQFGGSIESHGRHAMGFADFQGDPGRSGLSGSVIDLGSGAGLPALILAQTFPETTWTLIERRAGRTELLLRAVRRLDLDGRVTVVTDDVAVVAWSTLRASAAWVTARSFGAPADTAELGAPLLRAGGSLLTSEPFDSVIEERWPRAGLLRCGLEFAEEWTTQHGRYIRLVRTDVELPDLPRRGARKKLLF